MNLGIGKATLPLFTSHYMVFDVLALDDIKGMPIVSDIWDYSCASWNQIFVLDKNGDIYEYISSYVDD